MTVQLPNSPSMVKWYHHLAALPVKTMAAVNWGPFGGENSISAVIETVLAKEKGEEVNFDLSKSDRFIVEQFEKQGPPDDVVEYRELNHRAQEEILKRWGKKRLGVIWIGAGVFTLEHPLLANQKMGDWHVWTDASPRIVQSALGTFNELQERQQMGKLSQSIILPPDIVKLNEIIEFISPHIEHLSIFCYGISYSLTMAENYQWLSQLKLPDDIGVSFVFNGPGPTLPFLPSLLAAFHNQKMIYYTLSDIEALFQATVPGSEVVWLSPRAETRHKRWETWLISVKAGRS